MIRLETCKSKIKVFTFAIKIDLVDTAEYCALAYSKQLQIMTLSLKSRKRGGAGGEKTLLLLTNVSISILLVIRITNFHRNLFRLSISYNAIMRYRSKF